MSISRPLATRPEAADEHGEVPPSALANRARHHRWRDPRLWLGALLVLGSVVVGAKVMSAVDATTPVWQINEDMRAGLPLSTDDLQSTRVHFDDASAGDRYLSAEEALPPDARTLTALEAGELLSRSAVTTGEPALSPQLPLGVSEAGLPGDLVAGDRVDVWTVPAPDSHGQRASRVLTAVPVASIDESGAGGVDQVLVTLSDGTDVGVVLDAINGASVVLVRVG